MSIKCILPDGRNVKLNSPIDATAFVSPPESFKGFSENAKSLKKLKQKRISAADKQNLFVFYSTVILVCDHVSIEVFEKIKRSGIESLMNLIIPILELKYLIGIGFKQGLLRTMTIYCSMR